MASYSVPLLDMARPCWQVGPQAVPGSHLARGGTYLALWGVMAVTEHFT